MTKIFHKDDDNCHDNNKSEIYWVLLTYQKPFLVLHIHDLMKTSCDRKYFKNINLCFVLAITHSFTH